MLKRLSRIPWGIVILLAVGWPLAWLLLLVGSLVIAFRGSAANNSGGIAAIAVAPWGVLLLVAPPLVLLVLRAIAAYARPH
jgi:hypothetical protein